MSAFKRNNNDQYIELVDASSNIRSMGDGDDNNSFLRLEENERKARIRRIAIIVLTVTLCSFYILGVISSTGVGHKYKNYYGYLPGSDTNHIKGPGPWSTDTVSTITDSPTDSPTDIPTDSPIAEAIIISTDSPTNTPTSSCEDECPSYITLPDCSNNEQPFLGGVDLVSFRSLSSEDEPGLAGSSDYQYQYNGYNYYFIDKTNMKLFKKDPTYYIPAYGGYCAWGISGEYCPDYFWNKDCLGPSANWGYWTIQNDRLFLFLKQTAKDNFMNDVDTNILNGDERWEEWYGDDEYVPVNTRCYYISADDTINHAAEFIINE